MCPKKKLLLILLDIKKKLEHLDKKKHNNNNTSKNDMRLKSFCILHVSETGIVVTDIIFRLTLTHKYVTIKNKD